MKVEVDKKLHTKIMVIEYEVKKKWHIHVGSIGEAFYALKRLLTGKHITILKVQVPYGYKAKIQIMVNEALKEVSEE